LQALHQDAVLQGLELLHRVALLSTNAGILPASAIQGKPSFGQPTEERLSGFACRNNEVLGLASRRQVVAATLLLLALSSAEC
ncbi:MAG TPA: hypothetical protein VF431_03035, partial [Candidatus Methylomirabilis sp.]